MTDKTKLILKIVAAMILIIGTPILFFFGIGENPFLDRSNGTKTIAVVNEDAGTEKETSKLDFGKEVAPILKEDSDYEWTVVSRSNAEKGLASRDYDAIVYIPSDFSQNIMTYESDRPVKAKFNYLVSDLLNNANREKVLREIDQATLRVNGKISTLYWSYVSQDLEKVRQQFDGILDKEQEFLDTISEYYQPTVASVVGDIESQREMLAGLQSSLENENSMVEGNADEAKSLEEDLTQFVTSVDQYQEYQTTQQQLLQTLQDEGVTAITDFSEEREPSYTSIKAYLEEKNALLNENINILGQTIATNNENLTNLSAQVIEQRDEIIDLLRDVEGALIIQYEQQVIALKEELTKVVPAAKPEPEVEVPSVQQIDTSAMSYLNASKIQALDGERQKLLTLVESINAMKEEMHFENPIEEISALNDQLTQLSDQIAEIEANITQIQLEEQQLQQELKPVVNEPVKVVTEDEQRDEIKQQIEQKEAEILNAENMSEGKKGRLAKVFNQPTQNQTIETLMNYYAALEKYEAAITNSLTEDKNLRQIASNINSILGINEDEDTYLDQLQVGLPASQTQLQQLETSITDFFTEYMETIDTNYEAISTELDSIVNNASQVREGLTVLIAEAPTEGVSDGPSLVSSQSSISQGLQSISDSMGYIAENQENIMAQTNQLYAKAADVNADTNELNFKWTENVKTTELYRNDIHDILNNAFIDGQRNGEIYDHLATPLAANSLDTTVPENKMPPVIVLVIVLISSLMIGYFCYYFKNDNKLVRVALFILLNVIVGLIISMYGLDLYSLNEASGIEWTIFTILLLTATSTVIFAGFSIHQVVGWLVNIGVILFFITPMLTLLASNINYDDPMSKVYLSIQYGPESLIIAAVVVLVVIIAVAAALPFIVNRVKNGLGNEDEDAMYEA